MMARCSADRRPERRFGHADPPRLGHLAPLRPIRLAERPSAKMEGARPPQRLPTGAPVRHTTSPALSTHASNVLNFTGERFAPEVKGTIWYEHWHRYCIVQEVARGRSVLDAACGEGYGSFLLAQTAREVVGIDISAEAIEHARSRYVAPSLRYVEGSCTAVP